MPDPGALLAGRVALVTGANHGIGAATARALAAAGAAVALAWWALDDPAEDGTPAAYAEQRAAGAEPVVDAIRAGGGRAVTVEADLRSTDAPARLFDAAEAAFGPVDVLVNNASGWAQDSSSGAAADHVGRRQHPVTASIDRNLEVDARAPALLIAELARRHVVRGATWGRIVGLTSGGRDGFPGEVSYGAAKAAQESYTLAAAVELAPHGITANVVHPPVTDTGWVTEPTMAHPPILWPWARPAPAVGG